MSNWTVVFTRPMYVIDNLMTLDDLHALRQDAESCRMDDLEYARLMLAVLDENRSFT